MCVKLFSDHIVLERQCFFDSRDTLHWSEYASLEPMFATTPTLLRSCSHCAQTGRGTKEILDGRWYCASCADVALASYSDKQLAADLRFSKPFAKDDDTAATIRDGVLEALLQAPSFPSKPC